MLGRISFILATVFWIVMNVLLWRAEFGRGRETVSNVNPETVIDRLLKAPDPSTLQVMHHGQAIGSLVWRPSVVEVHSTNVSANAVPEGMVETAGYTVETDFTINAELPTDRWRVNSRLELNADRSWQEWVIRVTQKPATWELVAKQGQDRIVLTYESGQDRWEKRFSMRDLANPRAALGPYALLLPGSLSQNLAQFSAGSAQQSFQWRASNDWLRVGRNKVRVYRLNLSLFGNYEMVAYLSRAGEVLKVQLPDTFVLVNDQVPALKRE